MGAVFGPSVPARYVVILSDSSQTPDEDCTLEEEEEAPVEEEDDIDQFNDDTFGAGAIGKWVVSACLFFSPGKLPCLKILTTE